MYWVLIQNDHFHDNSGSAYDPPLLAALETPILFRESHESDHFELWALTCEGLLGGVRFRNYFIIYIEIEIGYWGLIIN